MEVQLTELESIKTKLITERNDVAAVVRRELAKTCLMTWRGITVTCIGIVYCPKQIFGSWNIINTEDDIYYLIFKQGEERVCGELGQTHRWELQDGNWAAEPGGIFAVDFQKYQEFWNFFSGCCSQGRVPWEGLEPEGSQKWFWEKYQPAPWESADDHWEEGKGKMTHLICLFRIRLNLSIAKEFTFRNAGNRGAAGPARDGLGENLTAGVDHNPAECRHGECRIWNWIYIQKTSRPLVLFQIRDHLIYMDTMHFYQVSKNKRSNAQIERIFTRQQCSDEKTRKARAAV